MFDAVTVGETMASFVSSDDPHRFTAMPAGAEANVAVGMARLGCRTKWVSRLGDDALGRLVMADLAASGIEIDAPVDAERPTGIMIKHVTGATAQVEYRRRGSAASALSPDDAARIGPARWVHTTGITAALSTSAAALVATLLDGPAARTSFDVNLRAALWPDPASARETLLPLARQADLVFIGDDEADRLVGDASEDAVADALLRRDGQEVVLKRGAERASVLTTDGEASQPALRVDVVDLTGAGDAFAAGYLAGACFGWEVTDRLRLGHLMGSRVVGVIDDTPPPFTDPELAGLSPGALAERWSAD
ncbi:MAG: sugar kinase [Acidimicrobiia bacterium]|nr:sugar kinase [Acidimicrobiia bacterium]